MGSRNLNEIIAIGGIFCYSSWSISIPSLSIALENHGTKDDRTKSESANLSGVKNLMDIDQSIGRPTGMLQILMSTREDLTESQFQQHV